MKKLSQAQQWQLEELLSVPGWAEPRHPHAAAALFRKGLADRTEAFERYRDDSGRSRIRYYWAYRAVTEGAA